MKTFILLVTIAACSIQATKASKFHDFEWGRNLVQSGTDSCGESFSNNDYVAAISFSYWTKPNPNVDPMCQKRARVTDPTTGKHVDVRIKDKCAGCNSGAIDLSPAAFKQLRDLGVGRFKVNWQFI